MWEIKTRRHLTNAVVSAHAGDDAEQVKEVDVGAGKRRRSVDGRAAVVHELVELCDKPVPPFIDSRFTVRQLYTHTTLHNIQKYSHTKAGGLA